jgi:hypothetical protein
MTDDIVGLGMDILPVARILDAFVESALLEHSGLFFSVAATCSWLSARSIPSQREHYAS